MEERTTDATEEEINFYASQGARTSQTHPIQLSWMFPEDMLQTITESVETLTSYESLPTHTQRIQKWLNANLDAQITPGRRTSLRKDAFVASTPNLPPAVTGSDSLMEFRTEVEYLAPSSLFSSTQFDHQTSKVKVFMHSDCLMDSQQKMITALTRSNVQKIHGNIALSSCPGKKVRLASGAVNGRAMICRDLASDFDRIASLNVKAIVCCLDDNELMTIGADWRFYSAEASKRRIDIIRMPLVEGSAPSNFTEMDIVLDFVNSKIHDGSNILCHCRGGIGRAALVVCCFLIRKGYCSSAEQAVQFVRTRRSIKAIETDLQEAFISSYFYYHSEK